MATWNTDDIVIVAARMRSIHMYNMQSNPDDIVLIVTTNTSKI